jgi:hypothetical protein
MRRTLIISSVSISFSLFAQSEFSIKSITPISQCDTIFKSSFDAFAEEAECWTPEQKKEFAEVFFIERGKFTIPKEPIVLKSFDKP